MELETKEEIHMVCLFDTLAAALDFDGLVRTLLPPIQNSVRSFGHQRLLDMHGAVIGEDPRMLLAAANIAIEDAVVEVEGRGGIAIAAHIDRQSYSLVSAFGFVPNNLGLHGIELTTHLKRNEALIAQAEGLGYQLMTASDAHALDQIKEPHCYAIMEHWSFGELKLAMRGRRDRSVMRLN
jgi:hypothetical protein